MAVKTTILKFLPDYAQFLLDHQLKDLAIEQLRLTRESQLHLMIYFENFTEEELMSLGQEGLVKLLGAWSSNQTDAYIKESLESLIGNRIPQINRNQILPGDVTKLSFVRRKLFRDRLSSYNREPEMWLGIMDEIDLFLSVLDTAIFQALSDIQNESFEQAQKIARLGNWVWDLPRNSISWSKELFRIYNLPPQDKITHDLASFNHPEDAAMVLEHMRISRETHLPHDFFYRIILPGGEEKILHARGQVLTDSNGKADKMFGTLQDVTEEKTLERQRDANQFFIQKVADLTPSIITVYDVNSGKYLYVNKGIRSILGYEPALLLEEGVDFLVQKVHPDDLEKLMRENGQYLEDANNGQGQPENDTIKEFSYRVRDINENYRWLHTYGAVFERTTDQKVAKVINISTDSTEQIRTNQLLIENVRETKIQQDRFYRMINEVEDYAILMISPEGIIENWNLGAQKIKGYTVEEIIGKNFRIFYSAEDQAQRLPEKLITQARVEGRAYHEGWRIRKDGSRFWGNIVISAVHNPDGEVVGFSKVTRDLTSKKLAEDNLLRYSRNLEEKNAELEEKNKELESFNYIAGHDLQEPLRKIKMWLNRIEDHKDIPEPIQKPLDAIHQSSTRMQALINGILQYSQTEATNDIRQRTDLNQVFDEVMADLSDSIEGRNFRITKDVFPTMRVVRIQFYQLFFNLISNAIKYCRSDAPLELSCTYALIRKDDGTVLSHQFTFSDNGIGFKQEHAERIFDLFRRLEANSVVPGIGLGLAICRKIVQNHQGTITAYSQQGEGATFKISFPASFE